MKTPITLIDGHHVPHNKATISVLDNALLYAEGLFETFLVVDSHILFADLHMKRLHSGAKVISLKIPTSDKQILDWVCRAASLHPARVTKVRLTITSGESARWVAKQGKPRIIVSAAEHIIPTKPFKLHLSDYQVDSRSIFRRIKTISYAIQAVAIKEALKAGCDDALLVNDKYQVAEVTSANIFWVNNGKLFTPPLSAGCLDGITRKVVIREAKKLRIPFAEKNCTITELCKSDEVFISSSLKLVAAVGSLKTGNRTIRCQHGAITAQLAERFRELAQA